MNRRELLIGSGALAMAAAVGRAEAQKKPAPDAKGDATKGAAMPHHHDNPYAALVDAASDCLKRADLCLQHCLTLLGAGDATMAGCAMAVRDTLASSRALQTLAAAGSKHVKSFAKAATEVARDCEAECRKHADKHQTCKDCAEACARLIQESAKVA
jgi:Cys-rich four helix bundle protein (predicted Tat secretion target)